MNQPTTHTEQLVVIIDGQAHYLTPTNKRGMETCKMCSLDSVCNNGILKLHLPSICCAMLSKGINYYFSTTPANVIPSISGTTDKN